MLPMAGRTAGTIKTKLGIGTHIDPRSVLVKVKEIEIEFIYACGIIEFMTVIPGKQQWNVRAVAVAGATW